jgi:hypothetical protein
MGFSLFFKLSCNDKNRKMRFYFLSFMPFIVFFISFQPMLIKYATWTFLDAELTIEFYFAIIFFLLIFTISFISLLSEIGQSNSFLGR